MRERPSSTILDTAPVRVIYIAGYGRSGSTLLDIALGNAGGVVGLGELTALSRHVWPRDEYCACGERVRACTFWSRVVERWEAGPASVGRAGQSGQMSQENEEARAGGVERRLAHLARAQRHLEALPGIARLPHPARALHRSETHALFAAIAREAAGDPAAPPPFLVDSSKLPGRGFALAATPGIDLHVIHLVRDPRAVVWSMSKCIARELERGVQKEIRPRASAYVAMRWALVNRAAERLCRKVGAQRFARVRYEDLVADPAGTIAAVLQPWRDREMPLAGTHGGVEGVLYPAHQVAGSRHRMKDSLVIRADEAWRNEMPAARQRLVGLLTGAMAHRYGYRTETSRPSSASLAAGV